MKIGIMSFAHHHAEAYIQNLRAIPQVDLLGVADEDTERGQYYARANNTRFFKSYEDLIANKPDGVIICSENSKHRPMVEMAATSGINILCEKPLATTLDDARAIVDVCERAGVLLMTAFPMRFSTPLIEVKSRLEAGDFGRLYCFNATNQGELPRKHRQWFVDKTLAGGGARTAADVDRRSNDDHDRQEPELHPAVRGALLPGLPCLWTVALAHAGLQSKLPRTTSYYIGRRRLRDAAGLASAARAGAQGATCVGAGGEVDLLARKPDKG